MINQSILSLEELITLLPIHIYLKDKDGVYLMCNDKQAQSLGCPSSKDILGKTDFELPWPKEVAARFRENDFEVMSTKSIKVVEESAIVDGKNAVVLSQKIPLYAADGQVSGILGISIDITERKYAEEQAKKAIEETIQLKIENEIQKAKLEAQAEISKTASQVAHDIRSPLSTLLMVVKNCKDIPEMERIALREAAKSIGDIANHLISRYKPEELELSLSAYKEERKEVLVSSTLSQLITDKKYQYKNLPIKFEEDFSEASQFAFIKIELSSFKRMISNLMNNAVESFDRKPGKVTVRLNATPEKVSIAIVDNGKGMSPEMADKIRQNVAFTEGKVKGHGIGLTQVSETLARNHGKLLIDSQVGQGTSMLLAFSRIATPEWIAEKIQLAAQDTVIILDDEGSIHKAWDRRFAPIVKKHPQIRVRHFENCHDAVRFIDDFSEAEKQTIYLLTDYELLKQELNGLHVVEKAKIKRSILVTGHYADPIVFERASQLCTKILPKQLASEIPIEVNESLYQGNTSTLKKVDLILVDDDDHFAQSLINFVFRGDTVDYFADPNQLKEKLSQYSKDTRIYLDHNFALAGITGITFAKELHEKGFTQLYLLSGETFGANRKLPDYLKVIRKDDIEGIKDW